MGLLIMVVILVVALLLGVYVAAIIFFRTSKQDPAFDDDHKTFEILIQSSKSPIKKREVMLVKVTLVKP